MSPSLHCPILSLPYYTSNSRANLSILVKKLFHFLLNFFSARKKRNGILCSAAWMLRFSENPNFQI